MDNLVKMILASSLLIKCQSEQRMRTCWCYMLNDGVWAWTHYYDLWISVGCLISVYFVISPLFSMIFWYALPHPHPHLLSWITDYPELLHLSPCVFKPCPALCCPPDCLGFLMNKLSPISLYFSCTWPPCECFDFAWTLWDYLLCGTAVFVGPCYHTRKTHLGDFVGLFWAHLLNLWLSHCRASRNSYTTALHQVQVVQKHFLGVLINLDTGTL